MKQDFKALFLKGVVLCFKPYLKPEEAMLYCDLHRTQFLKRCSMFGIQKNSSGYYSREELNKMMSGEYITIHQRLNDLLNDASRNEL